MDHDAISTTPPASANEMRIEVAAASEVGRRKTNADAFLIDEAAGFFAVSDGMGDTSRSGLVAQIAIEAVRELFLPPWSLRPLAERSAGQAAERLVLGVLQANGRLYARRRSEGQRAVTTFAGVVVCADGLWAPGDVVLACTDGVTDRLENAAIARALLEQGEIATTAQRLVEGANEAGGHDNATVVVVRRLVGLTEDALTRGGPSPRTVAPVSTEGS